MGDRLLYESDHTRVSRVTGPDGTTSVIRKESLGSSAARRVQHERAILTRLAGVRGVPQLVADAGRPGVLLFEDTGGESLEASLSGEPLAVDRLLDIATDLADTIAEVHRRGVIHKDISPANILVHDLGIAGVPARPVLIDYGLSTTFAEERPAFTHHTAIVGTPAYIAPEQTGRTGWPVDRRADLYRFGATLYELATGAPPFGDSDLLRLLHDHLIRVPVPACQINREVPAALSAIIAHLLEKEPDRRYQSAEGVLHDLGRVREDRASGVEALFTPGQRDFPWRLAPPSRLVGREAEIDVLASAFADAAVGRCRGVLVSGQPGVGKTVLVDELRPLVTAGAGWFLTGKFDQYRRDAGSDALQQTARALARMLLAEPEPELAALRVRLLEALGPSSGVLVAAVPELRPVLRVMEAPVDDPVNAQAQLRQAGLDLLDTVASPERPVVIVLDDLQWAGPASINFIDAVLTSERLRGVLLVGAYRESEVDMAHPLAVMLSQWRKLENPPYELRLRNLGPVHLRTLLAEMLRMPAADTETLAEMVGARTDGNPFDTVEFVNGLRRDGTLVPGDDGWTWDPVTLYRYLGPRDVVELLGGRIATLSGPTRELLEIMACLGNEVELDLLRAAIGQSTVIPPEPVTSAGAEPVASAAVEDVAGTPADLDARLTPALEEGLLVMEHGRATSVRFRHDRVQQAAYGVMPPDTQRATHLRLARRLAVPSFRVVAEPGYRVVAAEQYLPACSELTDPAERRQVIKLFRGAATDARNLGNHPLVDRYLAAAADMLAANPPDPADGRIHLELDIERHAALNALGRFDEVDVFYRRIQAENDSALERAKAACVQVSSLLTRGQPRESLDLGQAALADLSHPVPAPADLPAEIDRGLDRLSAWAKRAAEAEDTRRAANSNPRIGAIATIINRMIPAAYFCKDPVMPWLVTEAARLWDEGGPTSTLIGPLAHASFVTIEVRQDYATGYAVVRRILAAGENRGYEPDTSQARFLFSVSAAPWFEPLEETIKYARRAREGLIRGGNLQDACFTHFATTPQLMDASSSLDEVITDLVEGLAFAERTGNGVMGAALIAHRQTVRAMIKGIDPQPQPADAGNAAPATEPVMGVPAPSVEPAVGVPAPSVEPAVGVPATPGAAALLAQAELFDEEAHLAAAASNPNSAATYHISRGLAAAIYGALDEVARHVMSAWPLLSFIEATQCVTWAHLLRALAMGEQIRRCATPSERDTLLIDLDRSRGWLARRAAEAPNNFLHLRCLVDAERAWALGDLDGAVDAFERARRAIASLHRPWQQGLIAERFGLLQMARGAGDAGRTMLREARQIFHAWGATGKVAQLDRHHPHLHTDESPWSAVEARSTVNARRSANVSSDTVDMLAVLRASQALSSETNLTGLQSRLREVLGALTGATTVQVLLRSGDTWILPRYDPADEVGDGTAGGADDPSGGAGLIGTSAISVAEAARRGMVPLSALRYVERTREPLLVEDAARDERFNRDPYLRRLGECSLMVVPIIIRGELSAMLLLENQGSRAAMRANRLDTVLLIAGQLSVSLDNALLYAALEHKVAERTEALREANERLELLAVTDPLTGLANRRRLTEALEAEWRRALRTRTSIAIAMIDIDHFKLYNDRYGHPAGDECLRKVATVIARSIRETDLPARYGGEEFAVVLPDADERVAHEVTERIRSAVVALGEPNARATHRIVTVSVGIAATVPTRLERAEHLIKIADAELYRAKREGRNRISRAGRS